MPTPSRAVARFCTTRFSPRHKERLSQSMLEVAKTVAKLEVADWQNSFDIVVAVEDENEEDVDVPLVTIAFRT